MRTFVCVSNGDGKLYCEASPSNASGPCSVCSRDPCVNLQLVPFVGNESEDIYHHYMSEPQRNNISFSVREVLKNQKSEVYDIRTVVPGTKADPGAPVFGYDKNGNIIKNGGPSKSYNPDFKKYHLQINYPEASELQSLSPKNVNKMMTKITGYYAQRGFTFETSDSLAYYKDYYTSDNYLFKFTKETKKGVPVAIDLYLMFFGTPIDFEKVRTIYNGLATPIRIPITTDFCGEFNAKYDTEPIAYYDKDKSTLTMHIPQVSSEGIPITAEVTMVNGEIAQIDTGILYFDASFKLMRRNSSNVMVKASFENMQHLVGNSDTSITVRYFQQGAPDFFRQGEIIVPFKLPARWGPLTLTLKAPSSAPQTLLDPDVKSAADSSIPFGDVSFNITGKNSALRSYHCRGRWSADH